MGKSFRRDRDSIWDGEYDEGSFQRRKGNAVQREEKRHKKEADHKSAYEVKEDDENPRRRERRYGNY